MGRGWDKSAPSDTKIPLAKNHHTQEPELHPSIHLPSLPLPLPITNQPPTRDPVMLSYHNPQPNPKKRKEKTILMIFSW